MTIINDEKLHIKWHKTPEGQRCSAHIHAWVSTKIDVNKEIPLSLKKNLELSLRQNIHKQLLDYLYDHASGDDYVLMKKEEFHKTFGCIKAWMKDNAPNHMLRMVGWDK